MDEDLKPNYVVEVDGTRVAWFAILEDAVNYKNYKNQMRAGEDAEVKPVTENGQEMLYLVDYLELPIAIQI